jgi:predicted CXXCH cytochrome family protein
MPNLLSTRQGVLDRWRMAKCTQCGQENGRREKIIINDKQEQLCRDCINDIKRGF